MGGHGKKVNVSKIVIFESGLDFAEINFDVLNINSYFGGVPVKCETKFTETKQNKSKRNSPKWNGIIQNEINPILTKQLNEKNRESII